MAKNSNLHSAKKAKNDEFYTRLTDIEKECFNYKEQFKDKVIYCNCDDYRQSQFVAYLKDNFNRFEVKRLIATNYDNGCGAFLYDYDGKEEIIKELKGNGDFRSEECISLLKESDVVITNPPFSLFREYVKQLMEYEKKFLVIGNMNAITYKEVFPYIKNNELWLGVSPSSMEFVLPNGETAQVNATWYTNLSHKKRNLPLDLYKKYNEKDFPKYDNYDAIEVSKVCDIPMDYDGVMGVPITFLDKFCPEQFEILGNACRGSEYHKNNRTKTYTQEEYDNYSDLNSCAVVIEGGVPKITFKRILIRHKR